MSLLDQARIAKLSASVIPDDDHLLDEDRVIGRAKGYTVVYGPLTSVPNPRAEVIFVGLTPGLSQLQLASRVVRENPTMSPEEHARAMRREVAFAGSMRRNMVAMLDGLGLQGYLGVDSTADLFDLHAHRIFTTSALRYPVFRAGWKNYSGGDAVVKEPLFLEMLDTLLAPMLAAMTRAVIVPLGASACAGVTYVARDGAVDELRILRGFPHPSGANGHRRSIFDRNKRMMENQLRMWFGNRSLVNGFQK